jgi:hypothetical protein
LDEWLREKSPSRIKVSACDEGVNGVRKISDGLCPAPLVMYLHPLPCRSPNLFASEQGVSLLTNKGLIYRGEHTSYKNTFVFASLVCRIHEAKTRRQTDLTRFEGQSWMRKSVKEHTGVKSTKFSIDPH